MPRSVNCSQREEFVLGPPKDLVRQPVQGARTQTLLGGWCKRPPLCCRCGPTHDDLLLSLSRLQWGSTRSEQVTYVPASWSNPKPRPDKWFSEPEKTHSSWRSVLIPTLSYEREQHLDVEPPSALIEWESTNRRYKWVCKCLVAATELIRHPHTL